MAYVFERAAWAAASRRPAAGDGARAVSTSAPPLRQTRPLTPPMARSACSAPATPASSRSPRRARDDGRRHRGRCRRRRRMRVEPVCRARALRHRRRRRPARSDRRTRGAARDAGAPPADLTVVVVNATRLRADRDPAHRPRAAPCCSFRWRPASRPRRWPRDGISSDVRMLVGSGYAPDRGDYALDLVRRSPALREALGVAVEEAA